MFQIYFMSVKLKDHVSCLSQHLSVFWVKRVASPAFWEPSASACHLPSQKSQPEASFWSPWSAPYNRAVKTTICPHINNTLLFSVLTKQPPLTVVTALLTVSYWYRPGCPGWLHFSLIRVFFSVAVQDFKQFCQNVPSPKLHLWSGQFFCQSLQKGPGAHPADLCSPPCRNMAQSNYLDHALSQSSKH